MRPFKCHVGLLLIVESITRSGTLPVHKTIFGWMSFLVSPMNHGFQQELSPYSLGEVD